MKHSFRLAIILLLCMVMLVSIVLTGCDDGKTVPSDEQTDDENQSSADVGATGISLNASTLSLTVGGTSQLTAIVSPSNASDKCVTWSSSDTAVATVSNGTVTAVGVGTTTITATTSNDKTATCAVTVEEQVVPSGLTYALANNDSFYIVTGYYGNAKEYTIPAIYDGLSVIGIADNAFKNNTNLQKITIPANVESIGAYAFSGCTSLSEITIPTSVTAISDYTFYGCSSLKSVTIPRSVEYVSAKAFYDCASLTTVMQDEHYTCVGWYDNSTYSGSPVDLTSYCGSATKLYPKWTGNVYTVTLSKNIGDAGSVSGGENYVYGTSVTVQATTHVGYTFLGWYENDALVSSDAAYTFSVSCNRILTAKWQIKHYTVALNQNIADAGSVSGGGNYVYGTSVTIEATTHAGYTFLGWYEDDVLVSSSTSHSFTVSSSNRTLIAMWEINRYTITLSRNIANAGTISGGGNFVYGTSVTVEATTHAGYTFLGWYESDSLLSTSAEYTFAMPAGNQNLTAKWKIRDEMNQFTFTSTKTTCTITGVKDITKTEYIVPDCVTGISSGAFRDCNSMKRITLPSSVTSIGWEAFYRCGSLTGVYITDLAAWCNISFGGSFANPLYYAENLYLNGTLVTDLVIPSSVTSIGKHAFRGYSSLTSITIPTSVTSIGEHAFYGCSSLTDVYITDLTAWCNISFDGSSANPLCYAKNLYLNGTLVTDLVIPSSMTSIGEYAFQGCNSLTSITVPDSLTSIGRCAFDSCSNLTGVYITDLTAWCNISFDGSSANPLCYAKNLYLNGTLVTDLVIPSSMTGIGRCVFYGCSSLTSVTIPTGVTSIGAGAFYGCTGLTSITIPSGVTSIESSAFESCSDLTTVTFGENSQLTSIGAGAFYGCSNLTSMTIPSGVTRIGGSAFYGCSRLTSITIPSMVTSIGSYAFSGCSGLTSMTIPTGVMSIEDGVFQRCYSLTSITIPSGVTSIGFSAFYGCSRLTSITIPSMVTSIGGSAFYGCSRLTSITIPSMVTSIGNSAFRGCTGFTSITIPSCVTSIGESAFSGCSGLTSMTLPFVGGSVKSATDTYQYPFGYIFGTSSYAGGVATRQDYYGSGTSSLTSSYYYIPASLKSVTITGGNILYGAFYNCGTLTSITIPSGMTDVGEEAFCGCSGLTSITIPSGVTSIGEEAFYDCSRLTTVTFGENSQLTSIGAGAFYGCSNLTSMTIPSGVTSIGAGAFYGCSNLTSMTIPSGVTRIGGSAFYGCSRLTSITIPSMVTSVGSSAFQGCTGLTSVTIPSSVTSIGEEAFYDCSRLTTVTFGENSQLTSIGEYAFYGCRNLTSMTIPSRVTSISSDAFQDCYKLIEVYDLSDSLTISKGSSENGYVGYYALVVHTSADEPSIIFAGEDGYIFYESGDSPYLLGYQGTQTVLTLPEKCNGKNYGIYKYAFSGCTSLTSITIPSCVTSIGESAFSGCSGLTSMTLPFVGDSVKSVTDIYQYPFGYIFGTSSYEGGIQTRQWYYWYYGSGISSASSDYYIPASLESVTITGGNILPGAFYGCKSLTSITIPSSVTSIEVEAFYGCTGLTSITIPTGVTDIWDYAFYCCTGLTSIYYNGTTAQWKAITKGTNWDNCTGSYTVICTDGTLTK